MVQMEWNEAAIRVWLLLKVTLYESSERLTFTAPAQSIKKSNQRLFARIRKPNYVRRKELRVWWQLARLGHKVEHNAVNWRARRCLLNPSFMERLTGMIWSLIFRTSLKPPTKTTYFQAFFRETRLYPEGGVYTTRFINLNLWFSGCDQDCCRLKSRPSAFISS